MMIYTQLEGKESIVLSGQVLPAIRGVAVACLFLMTCTAWAEQAGASPLTATGLNAPDYVAQERAGELSESAPNQLGDAVGTHQKGTKSEQKIPGAITVLGGQRIIDQGIGRSAGEVLNYVPNASAATQFHGQSQWRIRGQ